MDGGKRPDRLGEFFGRIFGRQYDPAADATMLGFLISTLQVRIQILEARFAADPAKTQFLARIAADLAKAPGIVSATDGNKAWTEAYRLERLLTMIEPAENLAREIQRRVDEAFDENVVAAPRLQKRLDAALKDAFDQTKTPPELNAHGESILRPLLLDVVEEIHWTYQRKFCVRPIQRSASNRIILAAVFAFLALIFPYLYLYFWMWWDAKPATIEHWSGLPLYSTLTAGLFGAFFSRLQSLQTDWNNLSLGQARDARDWRSILLRGAVGMGGALVLYFFLQSGLVSGSLFPEFKSLTLSQFMYPAIVDAPDAKGLSQIRLILPDAALALLVIWSFIAGFSERMVPGILAATETSLSNAAQRK